MARTEPRRRRHELHRAKEWPAQLTRKWKVDVGLGYASPVVVANRLYMFSRQGDNEVLQAFEPETGKGDLADQLRGALQDESGGGTAREGTEVHADVCQRQACTHSA
jgi:hypothetical protein